VKYDDVAWHHGGDFPADVPPEAGATHIGAFLHWLIINDRIGDELREDSVDAIAAVRSGTMTGARFLMSELDGKLIDEDFDDEGNAFALAYYEGHGGGSPYIADYLATLDVTTAPDSFYRVPDGSSTQEALSTVIGARYAEWVDAGRPAVLE